MTIYVQCLLIDLFIVAYLSYSEKIKAGLWDHLVVYVSGCPLKIVDLLETANGR
jgi:hypothetical protein